MQHRILPKNEWGKLEKIFQENNTPLPHETSQIAVAEHEGEIVGFLVLQFVPHVEPLWIREDMRGKVSWKKMLSDIVGLFNGNKGSLFAFSPNEKIGNMVKHAGMERMPWGIWKMEVN